MSAGNNYVYGFDDSFAVFMILTTIWDASLLSDLWEPACRGGRAILLQVRMQHMSLCTEHRRKGLAEL